MSDLKRYKERFGHCNVPDRWDENPQLGVWVVNQRMCKKRGRLSPERTERLVSLGFEWDARGAKRETTFADLKRFRDEHGHCNIPITCGQLGRWASKQRSLQSAGKLSARRKARLDALAFDWHPHESSWETMFAELKRFKHRFGHCKVPRGWNDNPRLAQWITSQRVYLSAGRLSAEHKARLDELELDWDPRDSAWETMFAELAHYKSEQGDCNVPQRWAENLRLAAWVSKQRGLERKLSSARKARLDALGFAWIVPKGPRAG